MTEEERERREQIKEAQKQGQEGAKFRENDRK